MRVACEAKQMRPSVPYLGNKIDVEGLHPLEDQVQAIKDALTPNLLLDALTPNL